MRQKESVYSTRMIESLNTHVNCFAFKLHGGKYQRSRLPDIIGSINGKPIGIETKRNYDDPTPLQMYTMKEMIKKGWKCFVVTIKEKNKVILINNLYNETFQCIDFKPLWYKIVVDLIIKETFK